MALRAASDRSRPGARRADGDDPRAYCDAVEAAYPQEDGIREWVAWAREHAAERDPLASVPTLPEQRDPSPEELQRYLPKGAGRQRPSGPATGVNVSVVEVATHPHGGRLALEGVRHPSRGVISRVDVGNELA